MPPVLDMVQGVFLCLVKKLDISIMFNYIIGNNEIVGCFIIHSKMADYLLAGSVFLNVILFLLVFFKSALNDILKHWWIEKQKAKKEFKECLIELRTNLYKLQSSSTLLIIAMALRRIEKNPETKAMLDDQYKNNLKVYGEVSNNMLKNEMFFPEDIREQIKQFQKNIGELTVEVNTKDMYKDRLLEINSEIVSGGTAIMTKVDTYLS